MIRRTAVAALLALLVAGCGVPTGGAPTTIPASEVPFGLADPAAPTTSSDAPEVLADTSRVWLLSGEVLVPRGREIEGASRRERLTDLLAELAAGPTAAEREQQLSTALPPEVRLTLVDVDEGTATIAFDAFALTPSGVASRRSVAQIVLTATSVPGVDAVLLELDGEPVEAPLASGELTRRPLTADDYRAFTVPPAPSAVPEPVPAEPAPAEPVPGATPAPPS